MKIIFSEEFQDDFRRIKDKSTRLRIIKHIKKLGEMPQSGKPLRFELKEYRTVRVPPFRILYRLEGDKIIVNCFEHRKEVYR